MMTSRAKTGGFDGKTSENVGGDLLPGIHSTATMAANHASTSRGSLLCTSSSIPPTPSHVTPILVMTRSKESMAIPPNTGAARWRPPLLLSLHQDDEKPEKAKRVNAGTRPQNNAAQHPVFIDDYSDLSAPQSDQATMAAEELNLDDNNSDSHVDEEDYLPLDDPTGEGMEMMAKTAEDAMYELATLGELNLQDRDRPRPDAMIRPEPGASQGKQLIIWDPSAHDRRNDPAIDDHTS